MIIKSKAWVKTPQVRGSSVSIGGSGTGEAFDAVLLSKRCWLMEKSAKMVVWLASMMVTSPWRLVTMTLILIRHSMAWVEGYLGSCMAFFLASGVSVSIGMEVGGGDL